LTDNKRFFLGIDAGATSTEVLLIESPTRSGTRLKIHDYKIQKFGAINCNVLGINKTIEQLTKIIRKVSTKVGLENVTSITAGIAGAGNKKVREQIRKALAKKLGDKKIKIHPDTEIAFASIFKPNETNCGILIAGTGSILYYRDGKGKTGKIGGFGRLIDDLGSGYWIGREALNAAAKFYDRRSKKTLLVDALKKRFGINERTIVQKIYHQGFSIGNVAELVFRCAEKNDSGAKEIIKRAAEHLADHFPALPKRKMKIGFIGSLFTKEILLEKYLRKIAKEKYPHINFVKAKHPPVWGAVKIASGAKQSHD